jgi:hypothetical protein
MEEGHKFISSYITRYPRKTKFICLLIYWFIYIHLWNYTNKLIKLVRATPVVCDWFLWGRRDGDVFIMDETCCIDAMTSGYAAKKEYVVF